MSVEFLSPRFLLAGALASIGLLVVMAGALAALRAPDTLMRLHAVRAASFGAPLVLAGAAVEAWDAGVTARLALVAAIIALTGPGLSHLMAQQAHKLRDGSAERR